MRKSEIIEQLKANIPFELYSKYSYLSLNQMAEVPELSPWADDIRKAEGEAAETNTSWF